MNKAQGQEANTEYGEPAITEGDLWHCSCGTKAKWNKLVDDTNNERAGYVELEIDQPGQLLLAEGQELVPDSQFC